ncbi:synaptopodin isoform X2 [Numida meleagris]|uniref:synaptopodin isoform X2 n=1 Tax=Numida meleagris TaxID=8996 RepID=UPI000B3E1782|nr:synaptopodin isoform X2 [Numida meleagris]
MLKAPLPQESGSGDVLDPELPTGSMNTEPAATPECCAPSPAPQLPPEAAGPVDDPSQEWRLVKIKRVLIGPSSEPRKASLSRSSSLSEKELKEAKARSRRIVAQLTTAPGPSSKGVLLFHRRRQRVDGLTGTGTGHGTGLPLSLGTQRGDMEEGEGHGTRGTPGEQEDVASLRESPAEAQQVPLSIYLKENMALAAANGVHKEKVESEVGGVQGTQDSLGTRMATPAPPESVCIPEQKNGEVPTVPVVTANAPMGTASMTMGTTVMPLGTESVPMGTATMPVVTANMTVRRASTPIGTASTPVVTASAPTVTASIPTGMTMANSAMGAASVPMVSANITTGTASAPTVTASMPTGTASMPIGTASTHIVTTSVPMGTASTPMVAASIPMGMADTPMGMASAPVGTASPPTVTSNMPTVTASTPPGSAPPATQAQSGAQGRQYYEVHLTLAKPKPVKNRTARPFGTQTPPGLSQPPEQPPGTERPPPTYAETLGSPPPLSRVRSPPSYSALYPPGEQKALLGPGYGLEAVVPLPKTGILEESAARRGHKKSMFTFVEKPKLGPNPDLLDLVQSADIRKKQKEHGEPGAEDEPFALGAEAANFVPTSASRAAQPLPVPDDAPAWSSCLKSPTVQPKPKPQPSHNLSEARGKGAELFARRQSRMEKFIIEAPSRPELLRSPSPTMSLPPSWKYDANACLSPMVSRHPSRSPSRPSKTPPASLYGNNPMENEVEPSKHQPYQLQPSLFILSPSKAPARSMPPPRPSPPSAYPYPQHTSCPTSPLPPSPIWQPPTTHGAASSPFPGATGALPMTHGAGGGGAELLLASPCHGRSPRAKGFQAPRPSYSTRNAGIEPQERRPSLPASPTWTPRLARHQGSQDGWASPPTVPELEQGPPRSPPWSERSLSPQRQDTEPHASRQMQARLARNIINAARRKSSSPKPLGPDGSRPFTPPAVGPPTLPQGCKATAPQRARSMLAAPGSPSPSHKSPLTEGPCASPGVSRATWAESRRLLLSPSPAGLSPTPKSPLPSPVVGARSPAKRYNSRSPTDSDVSIDSEDSGTKSPGIHSFNLCPRGWSGSLRLKAGGLPSGAPCTS